MAGAAQIENIDWPRLARLPFVNLELGARKFIGR